MLSHGEVLAVLEELAPEVCAEPGDAPRFETRAGDRCTRLGVCTEPTERNLVLAANGGVDFMITHHAWHDEAAAVVQAKGMSIYRLHSAWDLAPDGNAVTLARVLGLRGLVLADGALTGAADLSLRELIERCQRVTARSVLPYCGDPAHQVRTVGLLPGSGFIPLFSRRWDDLVGAGCDTIISGEISQAAARYAHCARVNLVDLGHSGLVRPGMMHLAYLLRSRLAAHGCRAEFYEDTYAVSYFTASSLPRQEKGRDEGPSGGVVLPFPS